MPEFLHEMLPVPYRVVEARDEIPDVRTLVLEPVGEAKVAPRPGQFAMLTAPGFGECAISYSRIQSERVHHTIRAVGMVSTALTQMEEGKIVGVRGAFGTAWPVEEARGRDLVVLAGGLGLAPLRPVLDEVMARRAEFGRVVLVAGAREPELFLYLAEIEALGIDVELTVDVASPGWSHDVGVVTSLLPHLDVDADSAVAMVCGPEVMMRFGVLGLLKMGFSPARTYVSLERNMKCGFGLCGHCQFGPYFVCKDGPVMAFERVQPIFDLREY